MNFSAFHKRVVVSALMAVMAMGAIAPAAFAGQGRGNGNKYRRSEVYQSQGQYRSYGGYRGNSYPTSSYRSHSNAVPVIAGIIGGIAIGALLTSASRPAYAEQQQYRYDDQDVYYVDPYEDQTYSSLNIYVGNTESCNHPRLVRVMDRRSDRCLRTIRYSQGGWSDCGQGYGGYSDSYYGGNGGGYGRGGYSRGGYDRGYNRGGYDRGYNRGGYDRGYSRGQGRGQGRGCEQRGNNDGQWGDDN